MNEVKCPVCGESHYTVTSRMSTLIGYNPIYVDGRLISSDPNTTTVSCECLNCGEHFSFYEGGASC